MAARSAIPIIILTGFLGSGKTTLLAKWMRAPEFSRAMVIVNEMGEVGLDAHLVQSASEAPVMLDNGCACCEGAENLNATLERLFWDRLHRRIAPFDWIIIETSGAADPGALIAALNANPVVRERYVLTAVVCIFDAMHGQTWLERRSECASQVLHADCVIIAKTDLAGTLQIEAARQAVQVRNPHAVVMTSRQGDAPAGTIARLASLQHENRDTAALSKGGRFAHHTNLVQAFAATPAPVAREALKQALSDLLASHGANLLRIKGLVQTEGGRHVIAQWPPGAAAVHLADLDAEDTGSVKHGLTFIAENNQAAAIAQAFLERLGMMSGTSATAVRPMEAVRHAS